MGLIFNQDFDMPGTPTRQTFPIVSFGWFVGIPPPCAIAPGETKYVKEGPYLSPAVDDGWMCGMNRAFGVRFYFPEADVNGLTFLIFTSIDGTNYSVIDNVLVLSGGALSSTSPFSNYIIDAWTAKFAIYNPGPATFTGKCMISARAL